MRWIDTEKPALVETLRHADPEAPTLCEGWTTRHLLAHLVQREQNQLANLGDMIVRRPPGQEKYLGRLVEEARTPEGYDALVSRFAAGPVRWSAMNWGAETLNFTEYVIHHEDLRRAHAGVSVRASCTTAAGISLRSLRNTDGVRVETRPRGR